MAAPRMDHQTSMEKRLADAGAALDRLSATAKDFGGAVRHELQEMIEQLRTERDTLSQKLKQARALDDDAWDAYRETVDRAHKRFDADLELAEAELRRRRAETRKEFADTVDEELEAWRARTDELRVQARLARMDTGDQLEPIIEAMQRRSSELQSRLGDLREASEETWRSIREDITDTLVQHRRSLREADDTLPD